MEKLVEHKNEIIKSLKVLWDYMKLHQQLEKCDLIIGCGCSNLDIPVKCAQLLKDGYAPKILFTGGLGKQTKDNFSKSEAEIYKDIAIEHGVDEQDIIIETKSTNTGDNFRFSLELLNKNKIKHDKILIVHNVLSERRTLSSAKTIIKDSELFITSPDMTFEEYLEYLEKNKTSAIDTISVTVGDIQRIILYPQFGWQVENDIPNEVIESYKFLKEIGFNKYIITPKEIEDLICKFGVKEEYEK